MRGLRIALIVVAVVCFGVALSYPIRYRMKQESNNAAMDELAAMRRQAREEQEGAGETEAEVTAEATSSVTAQSAVPPAPEGKALETEGTVPTVEVTAAAGTSSVTAQSAVPPGQEGKALETPTTVPAVEVTAAAGTSSVTAQSAVPPVQGSADPVSLESVHRTDSRALDAPEGKALETEATEEPEISLMTEAEPTPEPMPTPTPTAEATEEPTPGPTREPGVTPGFDELAMDFDPHARPTATPEPTPVPTAKPTPRPTVDRLAYDGPLPYPMKEKVAFDESAILPELRDIYELNHDLVGWLTIPGTVIDYPVVQVEDSQYYLEHDFYGNSNMNGQIILDSNCDPYTPSYNLVISGHHMQNGSMFGDLPEYRNQSYWEKRKLVEFDTLMERKQYVIFAVFYSADYDEDEEGFRYNANIQYRLDTVRWLQEIEDNKLYDTGIDVAFGDEFITLTTCNRVLHRNGRFVVVCRRIREGETFE